MTFAKRVFFFGGLHGIAVLLPQYFMEARIGRDFPPEITHVENFYGFVGVALAWQIAFLILSTDPVRYRPLMIPSILEKLAFGIATIVLFAQGRTAGMILGFGLVDLLLAGLFAVAYQRTATEQRP